MSFIVQKDELGRIVRKSISISSLPPLLTTNASLAASYSIFSRNANTLSLNGTLVTSSANELDKTIATPGIVSPNKVAVVDNNRDIANFNTITCSSITINGEILGSSSGDQSNQFLNNITAGVANSSKVLILDSNKNLTNINNINSNELTIKDSNIVINDNVNYNQFTSYPINNDNNWVSMCWADNLNLFVAIANTGINRIMTSVDGITWNTQIPPADYNWTSICYSPQLNLLVAVSSSGIGDQIMTSSNAINWTLRNTPLDNNWSSICWSPELSLFVVVSNSNSNNNVMTSSNGITWILQSTPTNISVGINKYNSLNSVAAGYFHSLYLLNNGNVLSCGNNNVGQLGDNTTVNKNALVPIPTLSNVISISAGLDFSLALLNNGIIKSWGLNSSGQLGNNSTTNSSIPINVLNINNPIAISAGSSHALALLQNGTIRAWGLNSSGQLGNNSTSQSSTPVIVSSIANAVAISAGQDFSLALLSDGTIKSWGLNSWGQLGDNTQVSKQVPVLVSNINNAIAIHASDGGEYAMALLADGTIRSWGRNNFGQLGNNTTTNSLIPIAVSNINTAIKIKSTSCSSFALLSDGTIKSWGLNANGQLGDNTLVNKLIPVTVLNSNNVIDISCGSNHTIALFSDSSVKAWGLNANGQLGDNTVIQKSVLTNVLTSSTNSNQLNNIRINYTSNWNSICWSDKLNLFVAVGGGEYNSINRVMTSSNGINWNLQLSTEYNNWTSICWAPTISQFIAVANSGINNRIMTSIDGINWKSQISHNNEWTQVIWSNDFSVAIAISNNYSTSKIMMSTNGINWIPINTTNNKIITTISWSSKLKQFCLLTNNKNSYRYLNNWQISPAPIGNITAGTTNNITNFCRYVEWISQLNLFIIVGGSGKILTSSDGINWTSRISPNLNLQINSIAYSQSLNLLVAVGNGSSSPYVLTSSDGGINWISRTGSAANNWISVTWGNNLFVAIAQSATSELNSIMTSPDGINWTSRSSISNSQWWKVKWVQFLNRFIAIGTTTSTRLISSPDGINWSILLHTEDNNWKDFAFSSNLIVAISDATISNGNPIMTSSDGITWTAHPSPLNSLFSIIWADDLQLFIAMSNSNNPSSYMYSNNGKNWIIGYTKINQPFISISWSSSLEKFVAVSTNTNNENIIVSNSNINDINMYSLLTNNNSKTINLSNILKNINYNNKSLLKFGFKTWNDSTGTTINNNWNHVIWANSISRFVITGGNDNNGTKSLFSSNGISWTSSNSLPIAFIGRCLAFSSELNILISVGNNNIYYSTNSGTSWTSGLSTLVNWTSVCWSPDLFMFVAVGNSGINNRVSYSYNGTNWFNLTINNNNNWNSICWSSELQLFIAIANSGTQRIMVSNNGINWTLYTASSNNDWNSICWSPELKLFVAVASSGNNRIMTSFDGINWISRIAPENNNWNSVIWVSDLLVFIAISSDGNNQIMYSFDGINWFLYNIGIINQWNSIAWSSEFGQFIIVSNSANSNRIICSQYIKLTPFNTLSSSRLITNNNNKVSFTSSTPTTFTHQFEHDTSDLVGLSMPNNSTFGNVIDRFEFNSSGNFSLNIENHNSTNFGLALNNTLIVSNANQINSLNLVTPGIAKPSKTLILDSSRNITGINNLSCNNININSIFSNINEGIASNNTILIADSNKSISNLNNVEVSNLQIKNTFITSSNNNIISNLPYALTFSLSPLIRLSNNIQYAAWSPQLSRFVGVTNSSTSLTYPYSISPDGYNWNAYNNMTNTPMTGIAWSPTLSLFVGVRQSSNLCYVTSDGITWQSYNLPYSANWISICWSNRFNKFYSIAQSSSINSSIIQSINGSMWSIMPTSDNTWRQIIEVNDRIIAVANSTLLVSLDGNTWNTISLSISFQARSITYSPLLNVYVLAGSNGLAYSSNLINWITPASFSNDSFAKVIWINELNIFIAVGSTIQYSKRGRQWNRRGWKNMISGPYTDIVWSPELSRLVLFFSAAQTVVSNSNNLNNIADFKSLSYKSNMNNILENNTIPRGCRLNMVNNWISRIHNKSYNWTSICRGNNLFVVVASSGDGDRIITSPDGITWTSQLSPANNNWSSVIYVTELSLFVAVASSGNNNRVMTSPDGINWTLQTSASDNDWTSVCWSTELSLFVAVASSGTNNRVMTSPDGINWTLQTSASDNDWTSVCWSTELSLFVAVASSGTNNRVMTSSDGINWISRTNPLNYNWTSICWCPTINTFIAVANSGSDYNRVMTSNNGIDWSIQFCNNNNNWTQIIWINEMNLAVAISSSNSKPNLNNTISNNCIMTSSDGFNWNLRNLTIQNNWTNICWASDLGICCAISTTSQFAHTIMTYATSENAIIAYPNQLTINNSNGRVGLGINSPNYQLELSNDSAFKLSTATWAISSDRRLKYNIQNADLDECFNNVKNLPLKKYKWRDTIYLQEQIHDRNQIGWLADDVQNIFPNSVKIINANGYEDCKTIDPDQIIASLYGCIQKLIIISENKKNKIIELRNTLNQFKSIISNLEVVEE
jgi:alpha-tubulin suppressor-like RCC1 family protein